MLNCFLVNVRSIESSRILLAEHAVKTSKESKRNRGRQATCRRNLYEEECLLVMVYEMDGRHP
jgi:hypothetical protein